MKSISRLFILVMFVVTPVVAKEYSIDNVLRHANNDKIVVIETKIGKRLWILTSSDQKRERAVDFLQSRIGSQIKVTDKNARRVVKAKDVEIFSDNKDYLGNLAKIADKKDSSKVGMKKIMSIFKNN